MKVYSSTVARIPLILLTALVEELTALQKDNSVEKAIVFSQFVAFLDLIQWRLSRAGFNVVKLDGRMSPAQRDTVGVL